MALILIILLGSESVGFTAGAFKTSDSFLSVDNLSIASAVAGFFTWMVVSMTRKWMIFVRLAEKVFRTLDLPDPSSIDLVKSSKARRKPDDPGEYGTFYFRY